MRNERGSEGGDVPGSGRVVQSMRIASLIVLCIVTGCFAHRVTAPDMSRITVPESLSLMTPSLARLTAPDTRGLIVSAPPLSASHASSRACLDCHHGQISGPYVMIIDGTAYRLPEDSVRMLRAQKRLRPSEIENIEIIPGIVAAQRYHTDGRPIVRITTRRAHKGRHARSPLLSSPSKA